MSVLISSLSIIGSLAVFMAGYRQITHGLLERFSPWLRSRITQAKEGKVQGFFSGFLTSTLTVSNGPGIILLISMADLAMVGLKTVPWIILGINLGSTFSGWIAALVGYHQGLTAVALTLMALALPFKLFKALRDYSQADLLSGLGLAFLGIDLLNGALPLVTGDLVFVHNLRFLGTSALGLMLFFLSGIVLSGLIRSSIGVLILAMSLTFRGWISLELGAVLVLGSHLGLTLISLLASRNLGKQAKTTTVLHLLIGLFASLWVLPFLPGILGFIEKIFPATSSADWRTPTRLAFFHTLVHFLTPWITAKEKEPLQETGEDHALKLLSFSLPDSLDPNLLIIRDGLARMADKVYELLMVIMNLSQEDQEDKLLTERCQDIAQDLQILGEKITAALTLGVPLANTPAQGRIIQQQQKICQEIQGAGETCLKVIQLLNRSYKKQHRFHHESREELFSFVAQVLDFLRYNGDFLDGKIKESDFELAQNMEELIDKMRDKLKKRSRKFLEKGQNPDTKGELAFMEIIGHLEHVGDHCLAISRCLPFLNGKEG